MMLSCSLCCKCMQPDTLFVRREKLAHPDYLPVVSRGVVLDWQTTGIDWQGVL